MNKTVEAGLLQLNFFCEPLKIPYRSDSISENSQAIENSALAGSALNLDPLIECETNLVSSDKNHSNLNNYFHSEEMLSKHAALGY
ncbi:MAG: hypothetical protein IPJ60_19210 [Sphingobacteriaceae bacterium]|nr:hypothetical protein [Sphingobacteriaceae bacterium]